MQQLNFKSIFFCLWASNFHLNYQNYNIVKYLFFPVQIECINGNQIRKVSKSRRIIIKYYSYCCLIPKKLK